MHKHERTVRTFILTIASLALLALSACGSIRDTIAQASELRDRAAEARAYVADEVAALEDAQAQMPPDTPQRPDIDAALSAARARLAMLDSAIAHADRVIAEMNTPTDTITQGVGAVAPLLPTGAQGPVVLGAALIATILRARQVRQGAGSIAASIQKAMEDPAFKAAFEQQSTTIRSIQTPIARRIVDQETGKAPGLRSPI